MWLYPLDAVRASFLLEKGNRKYKSDKNQVFHVSDWLIKGGSGCPSRAHLPRRTSAGSLTVVERSVNSMGCEDEASCNTLLIAVGSVFGSIAILLNLFLIFLHFKSHRAHERAIQLHALTVACLPLWAIAFLITVIDPGTAPVIGILTQTLGAVFMSLFVSILVESLGGWARLPYISGSLASGRIICGLVNIRPSWTMLRALLAGCFQYTFIVPLVAIGMFFVANDPNSGSAFVFLEVVKIISLVVLFVSVLGIYRLAAPAVKGHKLVRKFTYQKVVFAVLVIQSLVLQGVLRRELIHAPYDSEDAVKAAQNFATQVLGVLVLFELIVFGVCAFWTHAPKFVVVHAVDIEFEVNDDAEHLQHAFDSDINDGDFYSPFEDMPMSDTKE